MSRHTHWNRKSALCVFLAQGIFALVILALSAADLALFQAETRASNKKYAGTADEVYYHRSTSIAQLPWELSVLSVAIATFLSTLVSLLLVLIKRANLTAILVIYSFWTVAWLGLFGYGVYLWHNSSLNQCGSPFCGWYHVDFALLIMTALELLATISVLIVATRVRRRAGPRIKETVWRAGGPVSASGNGAGFMQQPYPQYSQYQQPYPNVMPELQNQPLPTGELHHQQRPQDELHQPLMPVGELPAPQPFMRDGRWYQYQPAAVPAQDAVARKAVASETVS